MSVYTACYD
jgi:hypothetical protein